jgi:hypothetical protein
MRIHPFAILYLVVPVAAFVLTPSSHVPLGKGPTSSSSLQAHHFLKDGIGKSIVGAFAGMTIASQVAFAALPQISRDTGTCIQFNQG